MRRLLFRSITTSARSPQTETTGGLSGYVAKRGFRALFLSEFGGWGQPIEGHRFSDAAYGYGEFDGANAWREAVRSSLAAAEALEAHGLAGYVYTQISDVEDEVNGLRPPTTAA